MLTHAVHARGAVKPHICPQNDQGHTASASFLHFPKGECSLQMPQSGRLTLCTIPQEIGRCGKQDPPSLYMPSKTSSSLPFLLFRTNAAHLRMLRAVNIRSGSIAQTCVKLSSSLHVYHSLYKTVHHKTLWQNKDKTSKRTLLTPSQHAAKKVVASTAAGRKGSFFLTFPTIPSRARSGSWECRTRTI
jgi:hypothetical protein